MYILCGAGVEYGLSMHKTPSSRSTWFIGSLDDNVHKSLKLQWHNS